MSRVQSSVVGGGLARGLLKTFNPCPQYLKFRPCRGSTAKQNLLAPDSCIATSYAVNGVGQWADRPNHPLVRSRSSRRGRSRAALRLSLSSVSLPRSPCARGCPTIQAVSTATPLTRPHTIKERSHGHDAKFKAAFRQPSVDRAAMDRWRLTFLLV